MVNTVELSKIIEESGLKREYIAQRMGITRQTLTAKVQGESDFTIKEVVAICEVLGIKKMSDRNRIFFMGK